MKLKEALNQTRFEKRGSPSRSPGEAKPTGSPRQRGTTAKMVRNIRGK